MPLAAPDAGAGAGEGTKEPVLIAPSVWKAVAGPSSRVPPVGSSVYYFPEGHSDQCASPPSFPSEDGPPPAAFLCCVSAVSFFADPKSDEVFVLISLHPSPSLSPTQTPPPLALGEAAAADADKVVSFAKVLTQSDANNGGGFSVPRFCAESIFPRLDMEADPPVQTLVLRDLSGERWEFRHIYRGTPRRHLLTTGWTKFVNRKLLVAGDTVVFGRTASGELFVGVRRMPRYRHDCPGDDTSAPRNVRARVPPGTVVEAVRLAKQGMPFDVMYYPRMGAPEFVLRREVVDAAMSVTWRGGMRVRMSVETEDSSRMSWFPGTITAVAVRETGIWAQAVSPWRLLQVELLEGATQLQISNPALKKPRISESADTFGSGEGSISVQLAGSEKDIRDLSPSTKCSTVPAGMQGARHNPISVCSLSAPMKNANHLSSGNLYVSEIPLKLSDFSKAENPENGSEPEVSVRPDLGSTLDTSTYPTDITTHNSREKRIELFGKIITYVEPSDDDAAGIFGGSTDGIVEQDCFAVCPHNELLSNVSVQRQRDSSLESCYHR